jgi:GNAT superfamily N-acetyltransferase
MSSMNKHINTRIIFEDFSPTFVYELIVDGVNVGQIEQQIPHLPQSARGARYEQITHLYVEEQHRGKGYGRELVSYFEKKASAQGANWIEVNSSESAKGFYGHLGFVKTPQNIVGRLLRRIGINSRYYKSI